MKGMRTMKMKKRRGTKIERRNNSPSIKGNVVTNQPSNSLDERVHFLLNFLVDVV